MAVAVEQGADSGFADRRDLVDRGAAGGLVGDAAGEAQRGAEGDNGGRSQVVDRSLLPAVAIRSSQRGAHGIFCGRMHRKLTVRKG
jgi:hypothetical protein